MKEQIDETEREREKYKLNKKHKQTNSMIFQYKNSQQKTM